MSMQRATCNELASLDCLDGKSLVKFISKTLHLNAQAALSGGKRGAHEAWVRQWLPHVWHHVAAHEIKTPNTHAGTRNSPTKYTHTHTHAHSLWATSSLSRSQTICGTTWHDTDTKLTLWHGLNPKNALLALLVSVAAIAVFAVAKGRLDWGKGVKEAGATPDRRLPCGCCRKPAD